MSCRSQRTEKSSIQVQTQVPLLHMSVSMVIASTDIREESVSKVDDGQTRPQPANVCIISMQKLLFVCLCCGLSCLHNN